MALLPLTYAPDPIFKLQSEPVSSVNQDIQQIMDDMLETMYANHAVGMGAPMVGILKQIIVVDLQEHSTKTPYVMANPSIIDQSQDTHSFKEASICFPGITVEITRPSHITVEYLDYDNAKQQLTAEGFFATVLQHEIDYLHGKTLLDYVKPVKRSMLIKKLQKAKKHHHHSGACGSDCAH